MTIQVVRETAFFDKYGSPVGGFLDLLRKIQEVRFFSLLDRKNDFLKAYDRAAFFNAGYSTV